MNMKTITLFTSILIMALFSFSTLAGTSHFDEAVQHAKAAEKADDGETIAEHASMSRKYANASKSETDRQINRTHLDAAIKSLDEAIEEGNEGDADAAKKAASDAIEHFNQATK
jgi:soluble cytochrome b562